jgi:putative transposase
MFENDGIYHVFNRGTARRLLFANERDYADYLRLLIEAQTRVDMRIIGYCVMPNHWHLVVWPLVGPSVSMFMHRVTNNHALQHNFDRGLLGTGHVYQGRFKSVTVRDERQLLTVLRYVEANPRVAGLVERAEHWKWSSLARACDGDADVGPVLCPSPCPRPSNWLDLVNHDEHNGQSPSTGVNAGCPWFDLESSNAPGNVRPAPVSHDARR